MENRLIWKSITVWLLIMIAAIINGFIRNTVYLPFVGDLLAHQISTFVLIAAILLIARLSFSKDSLSVKESFIIGLHWLVLTEAFEFLAGHYLFGNPWQGILADYNVSAGRIWPLIPLTALLAPYMMRKRSRSESTELRTRQ